MAHVGLAALKTRWPHGSAPEWRFLNPYPWVPEIAMSASLTQEMNDDPSVPFEVRTRLFEGLNRGNRCFGIYSRFMREFDKWFTSRESDFSRRPLRFLELGAGSGGLILELAAWARRGKVEIEFHVMDMDEEVLKWGQARLKRHGIEIIPHLSGETHLGQFFDRQFDVVYSLHVLHHIQPRLVLEDALRDSMRVAAHGVFMMDFDRRAYNGFWKYMMYLGIPLYGIDWKFRKYLARDGIISISVAYSASEIAKICRGYADPAWQFSVKCMFKHFPYFVLTLSQS